MPKFAADLTMMFNAMPFPQRFAAGERGIAALPGREEEFLASSDTTVGSVANTVRAVAPRMDSNG